MATPSKPLIKFPMIIVNTSIPTALELTPNPQRVRFGARKVYSQTQVLGGYDFEHWGEAPSTMRVEGMTRAALLGKELQVEGFMFALEQIYRLDKKRVLGLTAVLQPSALRDRVKTGSATTEDLIQLSSSFIVYKTNVYLGFFTSFNWSQDAERPRIIRYDFDFLVTQTGQNMLADALFAPTTVLGASAAAILSLPATIGTVKSLIGQFQSSRLI